MPATDGCGVWRTLLAAARNLIGLIEYVQTCVSGTLTIRVLINVAQSGGRSDLIRQLGERSSTLDRAQSESVGTDVSR